MFTGSSFGEGVYTGNSPHDFLGRYGALGLLVLRLVGKTARYPARTNLVDVDTFLNDADVKSSKVVVLRKSRQCLAVFQYDATHLDSKKRDCPAAKLLTLFQQEMEALIAVFFAEDTVDAEETCVPFARLGTIDYKISASCPILDVSKFCEVVFSTSGLHGEDCCICMCPLECNSSTSSEVSTVVRLNGCNHELHLDCLQQAVAHKAACPKCREPFEGQTPTGQQPSGTMYTSLLGDSCCEGHGMGTIQITYNFQSGIQSYIHPSPGTSYHAISRTAFLPQTSEGRVLLARLQDAFRHGLIFRIGTSLTNGQSNAITWSSIPHKTSLSGGVRSHGYPDDLYFFNCHNALDALHVRPALSDHELF